MQIMNSRRRRPFTIHEAPSRHSYRARHSFCGHVEQASTSWTKMLLDPPTGIANAPPTPRFALDRLHGLVEVDHAIRKDGSR
nr:hypothetical protein [Sphingosinicella terrae]